MSRPLRVLLLIYGLGVGGAERQLIELARGLDRRRFDPTIATLHAGRPLEAELAGHDGVRLISLDRRGRLDFSPLAKLVRLLRQERIDIVQPFLTPATFFGLLAAQIAGTPVTIATERCGVRRDQDGIGNRLYKAAQDPLIRRAAVAVPNSEAGRRDLLRRGVSAEKIRVIYNGVSPGRTAVSEADRAAASGALNLPADARVAGIVARLEPMKEHETFLRAAARVQQGLPDAHFVIVGDGSRRPEFEGLARALGLEGRVIFAGNQPHVAPFIERLDVAVLSSRDGEGCSNFLLEAMALGKPIVCTDIGGNREVVSDGENGLLVPVSDPGRLADSMAALLTDPGRARAMGEAGRRAFHARFTVERMVRAYEDLYLELWARAAAERSHAGAAVAHDRSTR